jgi:adenylyltransferase/sulfurtransferase
VDGDRREEAVTISAGALESVYAHAREAFPLECCGYVRGRDVVVRCTNAAASATAYELAGPELVAFVRTLDTGEPATVVYHSHTNGRAYLSPRDVAVAATPDGPVYPVAQLVVGVRDGQIAEAALFAWDGSAFREIIRYL